MHITTLNTVKRSNNSDSLSFRASFALPPNVIFEDDNRGIFRFSKRYEDIKKYNPNKSSVVQMLRLDNDEYDMVAAAIHKLPKSETALLKKESELGFNKTKYTFNGITDKKLGVSFSNGFGSCNISCASNDCGDLHTSRETSNMGAKNTTSFIDRSRFNKDYIIENAYKETIDFSGHCKTVKTRNISIKDSEFNPILDYAYSRWYVENSDYTEFDINGRTYRMRTNKDGKVAIASGNKGEVLDFSNAIEKFSENERQKETFIKALKLLPPQILLELNETLDALPESAKGRDGLCLYNSTVAANSMINLTIKRLSDKYSLACDEEVKGIFKEEKDNFLKWLDEDSDGHIRKDAGMYKKEHLRPEEEIPEVIKAVCNLLWMEEYEENRVNDEGKRLLLNFFPETVNFIVSNFELNAAHRAA